MLAGGPTIMLCHFRVPLRAPYEEGTAAVTGNGLTLLTRSAAPAGRNRWLISGDPQFSVIGPITLNNNSDGLPFSAIGPNV